MRYEVIGNFSIIEKLGEGGMGEVFRGFDTMLEREVAIKSLRPELTSRDDLVERFRTEAIALARLNHPNITTLYSFFQHEGQYFMVMEYAHGTTLSDLTKEQEKIAVPEAVAMVCQALEGLDHAHRMGIVHKDIKPANIMVSKDRKSIKLMDFGIARILEKTRLTQTGYLVGTLKYMAPEQLRGTEASPQVDIYSLGAVLYELVAGRAPFESNSDYDLMKAKVETPPPLPRTFNGDISSALQSVILTALATDPDKRYASAWDFAIALQAAMGQHAEATIGSTRKFLAQPSHVGNAEGLHGVIARMQNSVRRHGGLVALFIVAMLGLMIANGKYQKFSLESLIASEPLASFFERVSGPIGFDQEKNNTLPEANMGKADAAAFNATETPQDLSRTKRIEELLSIEGEGESSNQPTKATGTSDESPPSKKSPQKASSPTRVATATRSSVRTQRTSSPRTIAPPKPPESPPAQITRTPGWAIEK